jgi:hypothetical protein
MSDRWRIDVILAVEGQMLAFTLRIASVLSRHC